MELSLSLDKPVTLNVAISLGTSYSAYEFCLVPPRWFQIEGNFKISILKDGILVAFAEDFFHKWIVRNLSPQFWSPTAQTHAWDTCPSVWPLGGGSFPLPLSPPPLSRTHTHIHTHILKKMVSGYDIKQLQKAHLHIHFYSLTCFLSCKMINSPSVKLSVLLTLPMDGRVKITLTSEWWRLRASL